MISAKTSIKLGNIFRSVSIELKIAKSVSLNPIEDADEDLCELEFLQDFLEELCLTEIPC